MLPLQASANPLERPTPQRVLALAPNLVEMLYDLGAGSLLVGRTDYSNYPAEAIKLPSVGSYYRPNLEQILLLKPDICLAIADGTPPELLQKLEQFGIRVELVDLQTVKDLENTFLKLGEIFNKNTEALQRVSQIKAQLDNIRLLQAQNGNNLFTLPTAIFIVQTNPMIVAGQNTFISELLQIAGVKNIVDSNGYPRLGQEEFLAKGAEVVFFANTEESMPALIKPASTIPHLSKILHAEQRIFKVNADIFHRPSMRSILALEELYLTLAEQKKANET